MDSISNLLEKNTIVIQDEALKSGFTQLPNFIIKDKELSAWARLAYAVLLSYAWQEGSCFPGQQRIADDLGISRQYVSKALKELREHNYIDWKQQGLNKPNIYYILSLQERFNKHVSKRSNR